MPSKSAELRTYCDKLGSSRITDRKKGAERLKCMLSSSDYLKYIDRSSTSRPTDDNFSDELVTWNNLLEGAESALIQELKGWKSTAAATKKPEFYTLVKTILIKARGRKLSDGKGALSPDAITEHISVILSEYPHLLASEYAGLVKDCLISPQLWTEWITPDLSLLSKILIKFLKGLAKSQSGFNAGPVSQAIKLITSALCERIDVKPARYMALHKEFFLNTKESNSQTLESMLNSVNTFSETRAIACRLQLSQFGDDVALRLIQLWQCNVKEGCKLEIVRFFSLQVVLHQGTDREASEIWQTVLWKLYELMYQEVVSTKTKLQLARNKLPGLWTEGFIKLLADVCLVLLPEGERMYEVSQLASQSQMGSAKPAKRRRITSGWESLQSNITECQDHHTQIAWIRVMKCIIENKDTPALDVEKLTDILDVMIQLLSTIKRVFVLSEIQLCFTALASRVELTSSSECEVRWKRVIALSVNMVERNQTDYFGLLTQLLKIGKLTDKSLLVRLVRQSVKSPVSSHSLTWLQHFLSMHQLGMFPVLTQTELEFSPSAKTYQSTELWQHLWVCDQLVESLSDDEGYCKVISACSDVTPDLYGGIIAALICKEPLHPTDSTAAECNDVEKIKAAYNSMMFLAQPEAGPSYESKQAPSLLKQILGKVELSLRDRLDMSRSLLNTDTEFKMNYIQDSLWIVEMTDCFLVKTQLASDKSILLSSAIALCNDLMAKIIGSLSLCSLSAERPYLSRLVDILSNMSSVVYLCEKVPSLRLALIAFINKVLDGSSSQSSNSTSNGRTSVSSSKSGSMFDEDDDFVVPDVPDVNGSGESQDTFQSSSTLKPSEQDMLYSLKCLVYTSTVASYSDITDLLPRLGIGGSLSSSLIAQEVISTVVERWTSANHVTFTHLLFYSRELIEKYHSDPQMGVASLDMLTKLIPKVSDSTELSDDDRDDLGSKIFYIINGLVSQLFDKMEEDDGSFTLIPLCDVNYRISLITCLSQLIQTGKEEAWRLAAGRMGTVSLDPCLYLTKSLLDRHYSVRQHAVKHIHVLFTRLSHGNQEPTSSNEQQASFNKVYSEIQKMSKVPESMDDLEQFDEQATRTATIMSLFSSIITCSPACSKKSLCALFLFLDDANQHINLSHIKNVLTSIVTRTVYSSVAEMCMLNLEFIVHEWVNMDYKLSTFPIELVGYKDLTKFYRDNMDMFVARVISKDLLWAELCDITGEEPHVILTTHMHTILLHLLPAIANSSPALRDNKRILEKCTNILSEQNILIIQSFREKLAETLYSMYSSSWDYSDEYPSEPQPSPPFYQKSNVTTTLDYLLKMFNKKGITGTSLIAMLATDPSAVTALHCRLAAYLTSGKHVHELRQRCVSYLHFITDLLPEMMSSLQRCQLHLTETISSVIINTVNWLLNSTDSDNSKERQYKLTMVRDLLDCFQSLYCLLVEDCSEVLLEMVPRMTYSLTTLTAHNNTNVRNTARSLLTLMWTSYGVKFDHLLTEMEPLPSDVLRIMSKDMELPSLSKMIDRYCSRGDGRDRSYLLNLINDQLRKADVYNDDLKDSTLLGRFTHSLVKCADKERTAAVNCLLTLGAHQVSSTVRSRMMAEDEISKMIKQNGDDNDSRDYTVVSTLLSYLLHEGDSVMSICDSVLASVLGSKAGNNLIKCLTRIGDITAQTIQLLTPYTLSKKSKSQTKPTHSKHEMTSTDLWMSYTHKTYDEWLQDVTCILTSSCNSEILRLLTPICLVKTSFCDLVLPYVIHDLLESGDQSLRAHLSSLITAILNHTKNKLQHQENSEDHSKFLRVTTTILSIIQYLRTKKYSKYQSPDGSRLKHNSWHDNFWLDVDYFLLADSAVAIKDYPMAGLFAEIKFYHRLDRNSSAKFDIQPLMLQVYSALDNTDMLYGWGVNQLTDNQSRLAHYAKENDWSKELSVRDTMMSSKTRPDSGIGEGLTCLRSSGLTHLLDTFLEQIPSEDNSQCREMRYEQAWRYTQWGNMPTVTRLHDSLGINECLYMTGKSVHNSDYSQTSALLDYMKDKCERSLVMCGTSQLASDQMRESLSHLKLGCVLKQISQAKQESSAADAISNLVTEWKQESQRQEIMSPDISQSALRTEESGLTLCSLLLSDKTPEQNQTGLGEYITETAVSLSEKARLSTLYSLSEQMMDRFRSRHPDLWDTRCDLEQANIFWCSNEPDRAMYIVKEAMITLKEKTQSDGVKVSDYQHYSQALRTYGSWLSETKSERPDTITTKYLIPAVDMAERSKNGQELEAAYHTLADFADSEYERLKAHMKSPEFQNKLTLQKIQQEQAGELDKSSAKQAFSSRYRRALRTNKELNEGEINSIRDGFVDNMRRAMYNHIQTVKSGSQHDVLSVSRLVAIWFENETRSDIRDQVKESIPGDVPTHKFIPLMIQLSARLSDESSQLQTVLSKLILKAAKEHPHHVIPILFSLKCASTDVSRNQPVPAETKSRAAAAVIILKQVISGGLSHLIKQYNQLSEALIELAYAKVDGKLPPSCKLAKLTALTHTHVQTHNLKPNPSGEYSDIPTVYKYENICKNAGGVNQPKIIVCIGSDGKRYKQLCKGRDDTRQDAVMQQVFSLVNELLRSDQSARLLSIRTYKIIPLSQRSGLLEWCEGTMPIGAWLGATSNDGTGAHPRYNSYPKGWSVLDCRSKLGKLAKRDRPVSDKEYLSTYNQICENLKPVMRHFFLEKFREPHLWLQARENYSKSVAVTSMVGYILGIGDRHTNNILIDQQTGELVHIDFGVAFEQGKALGAPEIIPFRLTRDIVDGFGPTGVNGTFKRSCEKTLRVLRGSEKVINTILQVLIDDPLLDWTLSAEKQDQIQKNQARGLDNTVQSAAVNESNIPGTQPGTLAGGDVSIIERENHDTNKHQQAESALLTIRHKLRGYELNSQLSISGQVEYLMQQATDHQNLCKMFVGWQPYL